MSTRPTEDFPQIQYPTEENLRNPESEGILFMKFAG
jgi:hypothetical protein